MRLNPLTNQVSYYGERHGKEEQPARRLNPLTNQVSYYIVDSFYDESEGS